MNATIVKADEREDSPQLERLRTPRGHRRSRDHDRSKNAITAAAFSVSCWVIRREQDPGTNATSIPNGET